MTNSATSKAQIQDFVLSHPNIYLIYDPLEHWNERASPSDTKLRMPMTQGNSGMSERSPPEDPVQVRIHN